MNTGLDENPRDERESPRGDEQVLDEGRDIAYQRREWTAQRVGWAVMALLVLAAGIGALGSSGPAATAETGASDGSLRVRYARLERHHAPSRMVIDVAPRFAESGEVRLWLDIGYAQQLSLESIVPEPESVEVEPERVVYVFAAGDASGPLEITFLYEHDGFWWQVAQLGLTDGAPVEFGQFVFP